MHRGKLPPMHRRQLSPMHRDQLSRGQLSPMHGGQLSPMHRGQLQGAGIRGERGRAKEGVSEERRGAWSGRGRRGGRCFLQQLSLCWFPGTATILRVCDLKMPSMEPP